MHFLMSSLTGLERWPVWAMLFCVCLSCSVILLQVKHKYALKSQNLKVSKGKPEPTAYAPVEPLPDFDWEQKEPLKLRPFKPKYNLTMSIEDSTVNELIEIDKNYKDRTELRKKIMAEHPETVLAAEDTVRPAVDEFYTWVVGTYLPTRFPRMFQISPAGNSQSLFLHSTATNENYPLNPAEEPLKTLRTLGGLVEDDLLFLLPSDDGDGYTLKGFVTCFPSGFNTAKKLNLKLRDIHKPVPHYKQKLEKSMDRYFDRIKVGKFIKRANVSYVVPMLITEQWTVTTSSQLFTATGNHLYEGEDIPQEEVDIEKRKAHERVGSSALRETDVTPFTADSSTSLSFKTYLYTLPEIKEDGLGETLAQAIDGLKQGNVPEFHFYKRAAVWGESAKAYLLS
ncbi:hypothetical protein PHISCL_00074 [Aspergillus sclerotialis]|uniref:Uncharacterized protein n=1 Tax=Aspergillus sclerotialis TaxID=2070753 RepID=A0A3A2ZWV9_9EURO|nr:hypothetical protein PHISCL_00074 [Aspergillus sclerotialis]